MELHEFRSLEEKTKIETAHRGTFLADKIESGNHVSLYHLGRFFVEVYYSLFFQKVVMVNAYDSTILLDGYLDNIDIPGLD